MSSPTPEAPKKSPFGFLSFFFMATLVVGGGGALTFGNWRLIGPSSSSPNADEKSPTPITSNAGSQAVGNDNKQATGNGNTVAGGDIQTGGTRVYNQISYAGNDKLPGFSPQSGFIQKPLDVSKYKKASPLALDVIRLGEKYVSTYNTNIFVQGNLFPVTLALQGDFDDGMQRSVGFQLDGEQKGVLLGFGLQDLSSGGSNVTYRVKVSAGSTLLWEGDCGYGQPSQSISIPLSIPKATSLKIDYWVKRGRGQYYPSFPELYFTKAELIF